ncbi:hypothetical protein L228DRAFT_65594 [Xylona heveae TC161]|uniref:XPG-I domain-containing protein n=1 Tax=Xylona heveae (strain CBS 132557 / TC161) TaxID=1328760 RepID=A0A161TGI0_XYLHT|nr:hypothetical protein L228DRAFT_65594 [Xylona heveae TC161]KZF25267.1 hypothetical protein L228DRAFT_65594 [Xylona heveae TC161]
MGIKGIYAEIGTGERVALSRLAAETFERTGRPLRIAIDISIWMFQIQSGRGGTNPAVRTFYYRLLRLLSIAIQPLFVFDGPHRPPVKRNIRIAPGLSSSLPEHLTKDLLRYFGITYHTAPGEAEAECALLQKEGIVDAVLSEDVDTLMFGCGLVLRNWSSESLRGSKSPTHVNLYEAQKIRSGKSGLCSEDMVLIALMSGGDYIPEGIPGCGVKVACEAAKAGFGTELCKISRKDTAGLRQWRDNLAHELRTNESKFFRIKHASLEIPDNFPDPKVLKYYTSPVVSNRESLDRLKAGLVWEAPIDISGLRAFVASAFGWEFKSQAIKFIRGLAPAILATKLATQRSPVASLEQASGQSTEHDNVLSLVRGLHGTRTHFSTDGTPELRVAYVPIDIVALDLSTEHSDTEYMDRDEFTSDLEDDSNIPATQSNASNVKAQVAHDPTQPEKVWILESYVNHGAPSKVEEWRESQQRPKPARASKTGPKKATGKVGTHAGALDRFVKVSKPDIYLGRGAGGSKESNLVPSSSQDSGIVDSDTIPPVFLAPSIPLSPTQRPRQSSKTSSRRQSKPARSARSTESPGPLKDVNPWTLSKPASSQQEYSVTRNSTLAAVADAIDLSVDTSPLVPRKHSRPVSSSSISSMERKTSAPKDTVQDGKRTSGRSPNSVYQTSIKARLSRPSPAPTFSFDAGSTSARPVTPDSSRRFLDCPEGANAAKNSQKDNPIILLSSSPTLPSPSEFTAPRERSGLAVDDTAEPNSDVISNVSSPTRTPRDCRSPQSITPPASPTTLNARILTPPPIINKALIEISSSPPMPELPPSVTRRRPRRPRANKQYYCENEDKDTETPANHADGRADNHNSGFHQSPSEILKGLEQEISMPSSSKTSTRNQKRSVAVTLRESLDGAWKEVVSSESSLTLSGSSRSRGEATTKTDSKSTRPSRRPTRRTVQQQRVWEGVEVLDLTGS